MNTELITGDPRLGDLEEDIANTVAVTDSHYVTRQPFNRQIFTERAGR